MSARKTLSLIYPLMRVLLTLGLLLAAGVGQAIERVTYYHNDALGSPVAATDRNGTLLWRESYALYGERLTHEASGKDTVWYTGKQEEAAFGLNYFGARWYDPKIGRFMGADPAGFSADNIQSFNRYAYANNNPYKYIDLDGRDSVVANGRIYITPVDSNVPRVSLPNNVGATGVSSSGLSGWIFHSYNVTTPSDLSAGAAGEGLKNNPTPGNDSPASPMGTVNDVGYIPTAGDSNLVRSYSVPSPDPSRYTDITVNHTIVGEHLNEGYVIRYGEIGSNGSVTLHSYGEGNAWRQAPALRRLWGPKVESTWQQNHREINNRR